MIRMLGDRVLVKGIATRVHTSGGLILPEDQEKPNRGKVVAVGPGSWFLDKTRKEMTVKVGDVILFAGGQPVEVDKQNCLIIDESDVIAVEKEKVNKACTVAEFEQYDTNAYKNDDGGNLGEE